MATFCGSTGGSVSCSACHVALDWGLYSLEGVSTTATGLLLVVMELLEEGLLEVLHGGRVGGGGGGRVGWWLVVGGWWLVGA